MTRTHINVIETVGLTKRFGERAVVDDVELRVPAGCAFGYLGPNGAGKTTLIRMLLGLTGASAGTMQLLGRPVPAERMAALARVGAIVEEPRFYKHLSGRENLAVIAAARGDGAHGRIEGALERVGLAERAGDRVGKYSLGMRQRLGIARCLLADPELLILDEPTNGLDPAGINEFRGMIRGFVAEGRTVLLSSHLLDEVERICDAAAIVDRGRVLQQGTIAEIAGAEQTLLVSCDQPARAAELIRAHAATQAVDHISDGLQVSLRAPRDDAEAAVADINRRLIEAGITVRRLELSRASLESRFLEITSRLGVAA